MDFGFKGLSNGMKILVTILAAVIGLFILGMIGGLIVGSVAKTATSGTVPVSSAMNTSIAGLETSYITAATSIFSNTTIIIGLIALVVLMAVFYFKPKFGGSGGKGVE
jgi:hypothetical protein